MAYLPDIDLFLNNPLESSRYLPYFSEEIKLQCIEASEFFALYLRNDKNPRIRIAAVKKNEQAALMSLDDHNKKVRKAIASSWESGANYLMTDPSKKVRLACVRWESCLEVLMQSSCIQTAKEAALALLNLSFSKDMAEASRFFQCNQNVDHPANQAIDVLVRLIEEYEEIALELFDSNHIQLKMTCASNWTSCAEQLLDDCNPTVVKAAKQTIKDMIEEDFDYAREIFDSTEYEEFIITCIESHFYLAVESIDSTKENILNAVISSLLEYNCWDEFDEDAKGRLIKLDEDIAAAILDHDLDNPFIAAHCAIAWESLALSLLSCKDSYDDIFNFNCSTIILDQVLASSNKQTKLEACSICLDCAIHWQNDPDIDVRAAAREKINEDTDTLEKL